MGPSNGAQFGYSGPIVAWFLFCPGACSIDLGNVDRSDEDFSKAFRFI